MGVYYFVGNKEINLIIIRIKIFVFEILTIFRLYIEYRKIKENVVGYKDDKYLKDKLDLDLFIFKIYVFFIYILLYSVR